MKKGTIIYSLVFLLAIAVGCSKKDGIDDDLSFLNTAGVSNIDKTIIISNDNSGLVTISPTGAGVSSSTVDFGHGGATATITAGGKASHNYPEGNHTISVVSKDISGKETTTTYPITVTYKAPEDITPQISKNANSVAVKATALFASSYLVYFGDVPNEVATALPKDGTAYHEYAAAGDYTVKVVAISGNDSYAGAAKAEATDVAEIVPFSFDLPITFDEAGVNYFFGTFGDNQHFDKVVNPAPGGLNTSDSVGKFTRGNQSWSGTYSPQNYLIDLSVNKKIKVLVYNPSPAAIGQQLNIELESAFKGAPGNGVAVLKVPITKSGQWEELVFDFATIGGLPANAKFGQLVLRFNDGTDGGGGVIYVDNFRLTN